MRFGKNAMLAAAVAGIGIAASASAATITWSSSQNISSPGDVAVGTATVDRAYYFGNAANGNPYAPTAAGVLTINGVTFTNFDAQAVDTKTNLSNIQNSTYGTDNQPGDYGLLLASADWDDAKAPASLTFNNLHAGDTYTIGLWVNDGRLAYQNSPGIQGAPCCGDSPRKEIATSGGVGDPQVTITFDADPPAGQFVYGTFVAGASQTVYLNLPPNIGTDNEQINGVVLAYTPEPASLGFLGIGGLSLLARRRRA